MSPIRWALLIGSQVFHLASAAEQHDVSCPLRSSSSFILLVSHANRLPANIPNMAEVVGLVAASGQFIEESIKIIKIAKAARDKYRDAPKEIDNWQQQVESLQQLVESIPSSLRDVKEIVSAIDRCKAINNSLLHTFDSLQFSESDSFRHKTWRAAVSLLKEGEIRSSFSELEQLKSSLSLHIDIKNL